MIGLLSYELFIKEMENKTLRMICLVSQDLKLECKHTAP